MLGRNAGAFVIEMHKRKGVCMQKWSVNRNSAPRLIYKPTKMHLSALNGCQIPCTSYASLFVQGCICEGLGLLVMGRDMPTSGVLGVLWAACWHHNMGTLMAA